MTVEPNAGPTPPGSAQPGPMPTGPALPGSPITGRQPSSPVRVPPPAPRPVLAAGPAADSSGPRLLRTLQRLVTPGDWMQRLTDLAPLVQLPVTTVRRIVVTGLHPGVGATSSTALLGSLYAVRRRDTVLAVDLSADTALCGRLGIRITGRVADPRPALAARRRHGRDFFDSLLPRTRAGLWLLPAAAVPWPEELFDLLRMTAITLIDRPPGPIDPADPIIERAHAIVLVVPAVAGAVRAAHDQLGALAAAPAGPAVLSRLLVMINSTRPGGTHSGSSPTQVSSGVMTQPWDTAVAAAGPLNVNRLADRSVIELTQAAARTLDLSLRTGR